MVGWTDPVGSRPYLGALLLAYYDPNGRLIYAGRVGTGSTPSSFSACGAGCSPSPPHRCRSMRRYRTGARFGSPLVLSRVHCVRPTGRWKLQFPGAAELSAESDFSIELLSPGWFGQMLSPN